MKVGKGIDFEGEEDLLTVVGTGSFCHASGGRVMSGLLPIPVTVGHDCYNSCIAIEALEFKETAVLIYFFSLKDTKQN